MSSQTRATSSTSSLWRVGVSGRVDFIPTKTSYLFAFKWRNQACTLSELTEEAGQKRCTRLRWPAFQFQCPGYAPIDGSLPRLDSNRGGPRGTTTLPSTAAGSDCAPIIP